MDVKKDIQNEKDNREIPIDKVGVKHIKYPIIVEDKKNKFQHTIADIDIFVELPKEHRGTHMSRFLEVLNSYHKETLIDNLEPMLQKVKNRLNSQKSYITIRFPYFIEKVAPVSKISSLLNYDCVFEASLDTEFEFYFGVIVPVCALCPCSKEISDYGAHNQRSYVSLRLKYTSFIWLEEIIEIIERSASCELFPLLKRQDEKYVTEHAFNHPVFVEDIVRNVTEKLKNDPRITWFCVESENIESIHNHSAYAKVEYQK